MAVIFIFYFSVGLPVKIASALYTYCFYYLYVINFLYCNIQVTPNIVLYVYISEDHSGNVGLPTCSANGEIVSTL